MNELNTLNEYLMDHCHKSMENTIHAERHPAWKRMCNGIDDIDFVYHGWV